MWKRVIHFLYVAWNRWYDRQWYWKKPLDKNQEYVLLVEEARKEWQWANQLVKEVKEKNLIDQAIYWQSAAERKYVYLLKQAAQEGVRADFGLIVYMALTDRRINNWGVRTCQTTSGK
ncbi:DUF2508 family protein [Candidatus Formimonas warabiya]|uniref:DUF2508 family protein n=1 Tax=Formimonas warabiya TaxID=1761012 RepID=A0A3G1KVI9_FORW1|nr:DUF2508 family protein [Candidatus Formimonas warabiya]ATW26430.1 hypothetical protein DCMF_18230 [Candidatus Formimonas warabiya]